MDQAASKPISTAEVDMIEFVWPWALLFSPLPVIVYLLAPQAQNKEPALQVPFFEMASAYLTGTAGKGSRSLLRRLLLVLMWLALVLATTRPQWIGEPINLPTTGRDLLLAVDISGSMGTEDM